MRPLIVPLALAVVALGAVLVVVRPLAPPPPLLIQTEHGRVRIVLITDALTQPWAMAFLPGGDMLVTERGGRMRMVHEGRLSSTDIGGVPAVDTRQQDGL